MNISSSTIHKLLACIALTPLTAAASWSPHYYAGLGGGWLQNNLDTTMQNIYVIHPQYSSSHSFDNNNGEFVSNALLGLGMQNDRYYLGLEGNIFYSNEDTTANYNASLDYTDHIIKTQMQWRYELDAIAGYYFTPRWLGYGKLGYTMGTIQSNYQAIDTQNDKLASSAIAKKSLYGGVIGLGTQYALTQHLHLGAEADYIHYANTSGTVPDAMYLNWNQPYTFQYKLSQYMVKATISYWF